MVKQEHNEPLITEGDLLWAVISMLAFFMFSFGVYYRNGYIPNIPIWVYIILFVICSIAYPIIGYVIISIQRFLIEKINHFRGATTEYELVFIVMCGLWPFALLSIPFILIALMYAYLGSKKYS